MTWIPSLFAPRPTTDEVAMGRVRVDGDPAAFTQLMERWEKPIRRLCTRMSGDEHRGEDLAQEAFARVFASRDRFDPGRKFSTWLWRIALNLCHEQARRRMRHGEQSLDALEPEHHAGLCGDEPHLRAVQSERAELVRGALLRLSDSHRAIVLLREYEHLKFREIAEVLDLPEGTVKWRMSEALDQLSQQLKPVLGSDEEAIPAEPPETNVRLAL